MSLLASWLASPPPDAAVEIAPTRVSAATMTSRRRSAWRSSHTPSKASRATRSTPRSRRRTSPTAQPWSAGLRAVTGRLASRPARVALIIPDVAAKVSADPLRTRACEARRSGSAGALADAQGGAVPDRRGLLSAYTPGARGPDGSGEFVVVVARNDVVKGYEDVCSDAGLHAGLVDIATFVSRESHAGIGRARSRATG